MVAVFVLVLLVCCGLTRRFIEAPMQRLGRRIADRLDARFGPDVLRLRSTSSRPDSAASSRNWRPIARQRSPRSTLSHSCIERDSGIVVSVRERTDHGSRPATDEMVPASQETGAAERGDDPFCR